MARELLGVPKPKESLKVLFLIHCLIVSPYRSITKLFLIFILLSFKGLLNSRSVLADDYGYAYMHFGEPISLQEFSEGLLDRSQRSCIPRYHGRHI